MNVEMLSAKSIFLEAIEKDSADRADFLDRACAGDLLLLDEVHKLLRSHEALGTFHEAAPQRSPPALEKLSHPPDQIDALIGPYKLLEQIGEGGMGLVYMAEQQRPVKRLVALKIIKPGMDTRQVIARFEAERQALAMMDHPNIAKVLDAGTTGETQDSSGRPYFVMELVRGIPINEFCDQKGLSIRERLELFIQVCHAVQHAHQKGIIHRDLKPTNCLITLQHTVGVPKIIDFGIAKALGQQLSEHTLHTGFAQLVGTPLYMSPEQAEMNQLGVDTRSDVYSLGVMLYELLTGTTPFDQDRLKSAGFDEMRRIIREEEPETVSVRLSKTKGEMRNAVSKPKSKFQNLKSSELDWIVARALEKDRSRRYESASALAADLQRYLNDEPVLACPPSALYRFRKFARRKMRLLATLTVIAAALLVSVAALAFAYLQAKQKQQETQQRQKETQVALDGEREALSRERQSLYYHRIALADSSYWLANDVGQAERLLNDCPTEYRNWEWHYLQRLCHTNALILRHPGSRIFSLAASPNGKLLATGLGNSVWIWNAQSGQQLFKLNGHAGNVGGLAFSPDGMQLASASEDQTLKLWDLKARSEIQTIRGHKGPITSVVFGLSGGMLASGSEDQTVKIWSSATGEQIFDLQAHEGPVRGVAFSSDEKRLASASDDSTVRIWDATTGQEVATLRGHTKGATAVAF